MIPIVVVDTEKLIEENRAKFDEKQLAFKTKEDQIVVNFKDGRVNSVVLNNERMEDSERVLILQKNLKP